VVETPTVVITAQVAWLDLASAHPFTRGIHIATCTVPKWQSGRAEREQVMSRRTENTGTTSARNAELRSILEERRREILNEVQERMRDVRAVGALGENQGVLDAAETSEADIQDDIELALIQMKTETLHKIEEALTRLDEHKYGNCFECGDEISERRLRALPFAVRCKDCEEARENAELRQRQMGQRRAAGYLADFG
jgi:DnaK suppressor protein